MERIKLVSGKVISGVKLVDKIDNNGSQYTIAVKGNKIYKIIERTAEENLWEEVKE